MGVRDVNVFSLRGEFKNAGDISAPFFPTNGLEILAAAIGTDTVSGSAPHYHHTFAPANILNSLTVEKNLGGFQSLQFVGTKVGKYSIKATTGDTETEFSASFIGKDANVLDTPSSPITIVNENPFVFAEAEITLFGELTAQVTAINIDIDNGLKPTYTFNQSHDLEFLSSLTRHITGSLTVVFDSLDDATWGYYTQMINGSSGSLVANWTHTSTGASLQITLPQIFLTKYADDVKMDSIIMTTLDYEAVYDLAADPPNSIGVLVINDVATAY
jgi:hypothetical protein